MKRVFVDSGGFFAHLVSEDSLHAHVSELFERAEREGWHLLTTNAVVYETHVLLTNRAREGREAGIRFPEHIERGLCEIVRVTRDDETLAIALGEARPGGRALRRLDAAPAEQRGRPADAWKSPRSTAVDQILSFQYPGRLLV